MTSVIRNSLEVELATRAPLLTALLLSLLLHIWLCCWVTLSKPEPISRPIEISLMRLEELRERQTQPKEQAPQMPKIEEKMQIVSQSEAETAKEPVKTNLLSDRTTATRIEQVRRGMPAPKAVPPVKQSADVPALTKGKAHGKKEAQAQAKLRLSEPLLEKTFSQEQNRAADSAEQSANLHEKQGDSLRAMVGKQPLSDLQRQQKLLEYRPFIKNTESVLFPSRVGVPDYLPDIQDGEVTLLNAKADRHAVFVRRVAYQVFGALRQQSWSTIPFSLIQGMRGFVTVHAALSKQGELLSVSITDSSGCAAFDRALVKATEKGAWDQNPPQAALAEDGKIHFIFKSRTWARGGAEGMREQRWLLLSTGLL